MSNIKNAALAALFVVVLGVPSLGMAQMKSADSGWYIGGHVGMADVDVTSDDDMSFKILGGYQINRNFAAEVGYIDFGKTFENVNHAFIKTPKSFRYCCKISFNLS